MSNRNIKSSIYIKIYASIIINILYVIIDIIILLIYFFNERKNIEMKPKFLYMKNDEIKFFLFCCCFFLLY